jgi:hypothetical protein
MKSVTSKRRAMVLGALAITAMVAMGAQAQQTLDRPLEQTYRVIQPQKVETGARIEVIDFFWYG